MKKILYLCPRNPFSGRFSADVIRSEKFVNYLKKSNYVDVVFSGKNDYAKKSGKLNCLSFRRENLIIRLLNSFLSFIKIKPIQNGFYFSSKINNFVKKNKDKYDLIFIQLIRFAQYLPNDFKKKTILDMGDIYSLLYYDTYKRLSILNPLCILLLIESILLKKFEKNSYEKFTKVLFFAKNDLNLIEKKYRKKLLHLNYGVESHKKVFRFSNNNYKILFIGNIRYIPNKNACYHFIKNILPNLVKIYPEIEFHIIGNIGIVDKFIFSRNPSVKVHGNVKKLEKIVKNAFCGIANINNTSGFQTKVLSYMKLGFPVVVDNKTAKNFSVLHKNNYFYGSDEEMIEMILEIKRNKKLSINLSKKNDIYLKEFYWKKVLNNFNKLL